MKHNIELYTVKIITKKGIVAKLDSGIKQYHMEKLTKHKKVSPPSA